MSTPLMVSPVFASRCPMKFGHDSAVVAEGLEEVYLSGYSFRAHGTESEETVDFSQRRWEIAVFDSLRDLKAKAVIQKRLTRVGLGNFGDYKSVGEGVYELRIDFGPGYRVYFGNDGDTVVILLCGGDKSTQANDIRRAQALWAEYQEQE